MEKKKKMELIKRAKGLLALVLCFGMMFGNSLVVFAATHTLEYLEKGSVVNADDEITSTSTDSGGVCFYYKTGNGYVQDTEVYKKDRFGSWSTPNVESHDGISSWKVDMTKNLFGELEAKKKVEDIMKNAYGIDVSSDLKQDSYRYLVVLVPNNASTESTNVGGKMIHLTPTPSSGR